ncbi:MAG: LysR family transcriptional regulator [Lachnospiraceae bacterium]|nr:LysR family transcriptional regulator [Lachnospiraceae bacterium]
MTINHSLEAYRVFYTVASCGSITLAAGELSISQPAVSQSIKQLEEGLKTKLFTRTSKGVRLTGEGELLYSYVAKGYEQIMLGEQKLIQLHNMELGEITIGASDMTLQFFLLPYLEKFHEQYSNIRIRVTNGPTPETLEKLEDGRMDFCVVSTPFEAKDTLEVIPVREIEDIFVAGRRFIPYKNKTLDFTELRKLPLIFLEGNTSSRRYMEDFLEQNQVEVNPEFELATSDMIVQFALRNLGVGCVVKDFAKEYIDNGMLYELRFNKLIPKRQFCIVKNKKNPLPVAAGKLLELISYCSPLPG